jgi:hypothetical protein
VIQLIGQGYRTLKAENFLILVFNFLLYTKIPLISSFKSDGLDRILFFLFAGAFLFGEKNLPKCCATAQAVLRAHLEDTNRPLNINCLAEKRVACAMCTYKPFSQELVDLY